LKVITKRPVFAGFFYLMEEGIERKRVKGAKFQRHKV